MSLMDYGVSRRFAIMAGALLVIIYTVRLMPRDYVVNSTKSILDSSYPKADAEPRIKDKVALISDTQFTANTIPLILHFHAVLGPEWPIVFYTSNDTYNTHLRPENTTSAIWRRAVEQGAIDIRIIPAEFNLTTRRGVNIYLSRPWLWEQLAPAKHVLVFQTDAMICGNGHRSMDDFLEWDFIAAPLHTREKLFNGGLSLRNRTMMLEILANPANNWEDETNAGTWTLGGEDIWFSRKMDRMGAHLPDFNFAITFACQHDWHINKSKEPLGYHKVHKVAGAYLHEIAQWCPEIALAAPGKLAQAE